MILLINKINNLDNDLFYICLISGIVILTSGYIIYSKYSESVVIWTPRTFNLTLEELEEIQEILDQEETPQSSILLTPQSSNSSLLTNEELDDGLLQGITFYVDPDQLEGLETPQRLNNEELEEIQELIDRGEILDPEIQHLLNEAFANIVGENALNELQLLNEDFPLIVENFFFNL
jgi:hypothetical protein